MTRSSIYDSCGSTSESENRRATVTWDPNDLADPKQYAYGKWFNTNVTANGGAFGSSPGQYSSGFVNWA